MTRNEFTALCAELLIDPAIALEDEQVQQALRDRRDADVRKALEENF